MDRKKRKNIVGAVLIFLSIGIILYAVSPYIPEILPPGNIPGNEPEVILNTEVNVVHGLFGDPYIESIKSTQMSQSAIPVSGFEVKVFPWEGVLRIDVTAPDGTKVTMSKAVKIDTLEKKTFYFTWKTRQRGQHILLASLISKDGVTVDQKQEVVYV